MNSNTSCDNLSKLLANMSLNLDHLNNNRVNKQEVNTDISFYSFINHNKDIILSNNNNNLDSSDNFFSFNNNSNILSVPMSQVVSNTSINNNQVDNNMQVIKMNTCESFSTSSTSVEHVNNHHTNKINVDYKNLPIDMALRKLVASIDLPNESQSIDKVIYDFALDYSKQNKQDYVFIDQDCFSNNNIQDKLDLEDKHTENDNKYYVDYIYQIAFSLLLLNTDLHNKQVKQKMKINEYIDQLNSLDFNNKSNSSKVCRIEPVCIHTYYMNLLNNKFRKSDIVSANPFGLLYKKIKQCKPISLMSPNSKDQPSTSNIRDNCYTNYKQIFTNKQMLAKMIFNNERYMSGLSPHLITKLAQVYIDLDLSRATKTLTNNNYILKISKVEKKTGFKNRLFVKNYCRKILVVGSDRLYFYNSSDSDVLNIDKDPDAECLEDSINMLMPYSIYSLKEAYACIEEDATNTKQKENDKCEISIYFVKTTMKKIQIKCENREEAIELVQLINVLATYKTLNTMTYSAMLETIQYKDLMVEKEINKIKRKINRDKSKIQMKTLIENNYIKQIQMLIPLDKQTRIKCNYALNVHQNNIKELAIRQKQLSLYWNVLDYDISNI